MKYLQLLLICFSISFALKAQEITSTYSNAEKFSKSSGKIIRSTIIYDEKFSAFGSEYAKVSLIRFYEYLGNDTVYALKFYGNKFYAVGANSGFSKDFSVIIDIDETDKIILWIDLIKKSNTFDKSSNKEQISYIPRKGNIVFRYYNNNFEIQYDKNNDNSSVRFGNRQMMNLYNALNAIKNLANNNYKINK